MGMSELYDVYSTMHKDQTNEINQIRSRMKEIDCMIAKRKKSLEKLENERKKIEIRLASVAEYPDWTIVLRKLGDKLSEITGKKAYVIGPRGICCRCYIDLAEKDDGFPYRKPYFSLEVEPEFCDNDNLVFRYVTGEYDERCPKGSLGEVNGMNWLTAPLPDDFDEILALFKKEQPLQKGGCNA